MCYMANQMSDLIENSEAEMEADQNLLNRDIQEFIDKQGYTWTLKDIFEEYRYYKKGFHCVSSAMTIFKKFENRLTRLVCT